MQDLALLLNDVIFIWFTGENLFVLATMKIHIITNWRPTHPWQQRKTTSEQNAIFAQELTFSHSLMACQNLTTSV